MEETNDYIVMAKDEVLNIESSKKEIRKRIIGYTVFYIICSISVLLLVYFLIRKDLSLLIVTTGLIILFGLISIAIMFLILKRLYYWKIRISNKTLYVRTLNKNYEIKFENLIYIEQYTYDRTYMRSDEFLERTEYKMQGIKIKYIDEKNIIQCIRLPYRRIGTFRDRILLEPCELGKLNNLNSYFVTNNQLMLNPELENSSNYVKIREDKDNIIVEEIIRNCKSINKKYLIDPFVIVTLVVPIIGILLYFIVKWFSEK